MTALTEVKERPILFSTPMVKAILEGNKTVTRRIIKVQPDADSYFEMKLQDGVLEIDYNQGDKNPKIECPYGKPGDILWVRETFAFPLGQLTYKASWKRDEYGTEPRWKPSIHMPKDYARIWLRIMDIRVERLQDITEDDAIAEGVIEYEDGTYHNYFTQKGLRHKDGVEILLAKGSFQSLWASINGLNSWDFNPWVWVLSFHVLSTTGRPAELEGKEVSHV